MNIIAQAINETAARNVGMKFDLSQRAGFLENTWHLTNTGSPALSSIESFMAYAREVLGAAPDAANRSFLLTLSNLTGRTDLRAAAYKSLSYGV